MNERTDRCPGVYQVTLWESGLWGQVQHSDFRREPEVSEPAEMCLIEQHLAMIEVLNNLNESNEKAGLAVQLEKAPSPARIAQYPLFATRAGRQKERERLQEELLVNQHRRRELVCRLIGAEALLAAGTRPEAVEKKVTEGVEAIRLQYGVGRANADDRNILIHHLEREVKQYDTHKERPSFDSHYIGHVLAKGRTMRAPHKCVARQYSA